MPLAPRPPEAPVLDLPDLDKSDDSDEVDVGVFELDMGAALDDDDEHDALDAFEVDIQEQSDPGSNEAASDLDIGESSLIDSLPEVPPPVDDDEHAPPSGEIDWHLEAPLEGDDPSSDAELGDDGLEALPDLLRDDGEGEAAPDLDRALLPGAPEGAIPKGPSYEAEWLLLGAACSALWTNGEEVIGCAEQLMRFGPERKSQALPEGTRASLVTQRAPATVVLSTTRGLLEIGPSGTSTPLESPDGLRGTSATIADLTSTAVSGELWARLSSGLLVRRRGQAWERHEAGGAVRSLSTSGNTVTLLVVGSRPTLQRSADAGSSFRELLLPEPAQTVALGAAPTALALERTLVLNDAERGLCVSADAGETFRMVTGAVNVSAVALGLHSGAPAVFAALHREARDMSELIVIDPATGAASSIAELSGESDEDTEETGRTLALIWLNGYLWAAGGYGLAKLRPA